MNEQIKSLREDKDPEKVTWRPPADEQATASKAAIKAFIVSAFADDPTPAVNSVKVGAVEIPKEVVIQPVRPAITLKAILKQAKNASKK